MLTEKRQEEIVRLVYERESITVAEGNSPQFGIDDPA